MTAPAIDLEIFTAQVFEPLLPPSRYKGAYGGRGSGKSHFFAELIVDRLLGEPNLRVVCIREHQKSLKDSAKKLIEDKIQQMGVGHLFRSLEAEIRTHQGGVIIFQGMQDHTAESIKSLEGFGIAWVEEAQTLSAKSLKMLRPTIRTKGSELWFSWNPRSATDPVDALFRGDSPPTGSVSVCANWSDNPWLPEVLRQEREDDFKALSRAEYDHIWEGAYSDTVPNAIIRAEWFDACVDAHKTLGFEPRGQERVAYDPADSGDDKAWGCSHGVVIKEVCSTSNGMVDTATDEALDYTIDIRPDTFTWDGDGMGMGLKRQIADALDGKKIEIEAFRGSEAADNPDELYEPLEGDSIKNAKSNKEMFLNKRAQYYWMLRDRVLRTYRAVEKGAKVYNPDELISFCGDMAELAELRSEVCRIPRKPNGSGRIQLMTKDEMKKKLDIDSPNRADVVMMLMRPIDVQGEEEDIEFRGWK